MILCGFCCAGKTTLGQEVAERINRPFYDTDHLLLEKWGEGRTLSDLCHTIGEEQFRAYETEIIACLPRGAVIAVGGGALLAEENALHLKTLGPLVYLHAPLEALLPRIKARGFPTSMPNEEAVVAEYARRHPLYLKHADRTLAL